MENLFKGIVKLTEEQYLDMKANGGIDENTLYVTNFQEILTSPITQIRIVSALPTAGNPTICYWVERSDNGYDQYVWINEEFHFIGSTQIVLDDYVRKDEIANYIPAQQTTTWSMRSEEKESYELNEIDCENSDLDLGSNTSVEARHVSITRNVNNIAHQALITIYDDGSVRISHRNKNVSATNDDAYIDLGPNKLKFGVNDILTTNNGYTKEEIDAKIEELKALINGQ
jgi:hypothetical protein